MEHLSSQCDTNYGDVHPINTTDIINLTATDILPTELCHYTIDVGNDVTDILLNITSATNVDISLSTVNTNNSYSDVRTFTSGLAYRITVTPNTQYKLLALPNGGGNGTISFEITIYEEEEEEPPTDGGDEEEPTVDDTNTESDEGLITTNNIIFLILCIIGIILCVIFTIFFRKFVNYVDRKYPYEECKPDAEPDDLKPQDEGDVEESKSKLSSHKNMDKLDQESVGIAYTEERKAPPKSKLSTFAKNQTKFKKHFKKLSSRKVMVVRKPMTEKQTCDDLPKRLMTSREFKNPDNQHFDSSKSIALNSARNYTKDNEKLDISRDISKEYSKEFSRDLPDHVVNSFRKFMNVK